MKSFRIQNLKSVVDSGWVDLAALNVVVGKNSSGKSTLLRTFPLLKQTVLETNRVDPVLWYGNFVDFGDFNTALNNSAPKNEHIIFSFLLENCVIENYRVRYKKNAKYDAKIEFHICKNELVKYSIEYGNLVFAFEKRETNWEAQINGYILNNYKQIKNFFDGLLAIPSYSLDIEDLFYYQIGNTKSVIKKYFPNVTKEIVDSIVPVAFTFDFDQTIECLKKFYPTSKVNFEKVVSELMGSKLYYFVRAINEAISNEISAIEYIAPIRAFANRYYRIQGVNNLHVNSDGSNAALVLKAMNEREKRDFDQWCETNLGVIFDINVNEQNLSIYVRSGKNCKEKNNIIDVGFGYSQMLPMILLLWDNLKQIRYIANKRLVFLPQIVVIEQPELHLHPAYQAKLINMIYNIAKEAYSKGYALKYIIETHSETIINKLGNIVYELNKPSNSSPRNLSDNATDVINVLMANQSQHTTTFSSMKFNKDGTISDWPIGFFAED